MELILIETATEVCSAAFSQNDKIVWHKENYDGQSHSVLLGVYIDEMFSFIRSSGYRPDGVVISRGPGSYTGLRIGTSMAKGIVFALELPLLSVNTLQVMASHLLQKMDIDENTWLCPMIDARRMEVYTAFYDKNLQQIRPVQAEIIHENSFEAIVNERKIICFGNGAEKCKEILTHPHITFIDNIRPLAADMLSLATKAFENKELEDAAYFEPFYLKEFVATVPKNKILKNNE